VAIREGRFVPEGIRRKQASVAELIGDRLEAAKTLRPYRTARPSSHSRDGADLYTVKKLLGHHDMKMTERYAHLAPDFLKNSCSAKGVSNR
jgi:site-specific recombinase XerD